MDKMFIFSVILAVIFFTSILIIPQDVVVKEKIERQEIVFNADMSSALTVKWFYNEYEKGKELLKQATIKVMQFYAKDN